MGIINTILSIFQLILLARVLLGYFPNFDRSNPIVRLIYDITEPVLKPIRNLLPQSNMGVDFSPLIVFIIIIILQRLF